jgi:hypothetical protein
VSQNFSACGVGQITGTYSPVSRPHEGRFAIVTKRWARDAVDACHAQDECADKRTAKSCGPDIPTLISTRDNALHCAGTETTSPVSGASTKETVKTIRAGNAGTFSANLRQLPACFFTQAVGAVEAPGIPCAL